MTRCSRLGLAVWCFSLLYVVVLSVSMMCHDNGLVALQSYVLLHNIISMRGAMYFTSVIQPDTSFTSYPYCFGLFRLPALIRFSNLIFLLGGCAKQLGEVGHHLSEWHLHTKPSAPPHENSPPGLLHRTVESSPVILALFHIFLTTLFWDQVWEHDGLVGRRSGSGGISERGVARVLFAEKGGGRWIDVLGGSGRRRWLRALFYAGRLLSIPLVILVTLFFQQRLAAWWITELSSFLTCVALILRASQVALPIARLLLNTSIHPSRVRQEEFDSALGTISTMEGVVDVVRWAWWRAHEQQTVIFLQLRLLADADPARLAGQCRKLLVQQHLCSQAFVECEGGRGAAREMPVELLLPPGAMVSDPRMIGVDSGVSTTPIGNELLTYSGTISCSSECTVLPSKPTQSGFLAYHLPSLPLSSGVGPTSGGSSHSMLHHHHHSHGHCC